MKNEKQIKEGDLVRTDGLWGAGRGLLGIVLKTHHRSTRSGNRYFVHLQNGKKVFFWNSEVTKAAG